MYKTSIILISVIFVSMLSAQTQEGNNTGGSEPENMSIQFWDASKSDMQGTLIQSDDTYFFFQNYGSESYELIPRDEVRYLETHIDVDLREIVATDNVQALDDVIEMNDGTKISCIILDIGKDIIQYFVGTSMKREVLSASSIYMVYMDDERVRIPFPVSQSFDSNINSPS